MCFYNMAIVSDTHDNPSTIQRATPVFRDYDVDLILHCGDVVSPEVVEYFRGFHVEFVLGNGDEGSESELAEAIDAIGGRLHGVSGSVNWHGKRIFFTHGHRKLILEDAIYSGEYDLVCSGHLLTSEERTYENTKIVNPGCLQYGSFCIVGGDLTVDFFDASSL